MSRRTLLIALFVSVAVNLFVVGAVVGGLVIAARMHQGPAVENTRPGAALWAAGAALEPERRQEFRRLLREQGAVTGPQLRAARRARLEAWADMSREPFDAAATARALDGARQMEMKARGDVEHRIVDFAARLPADERGRFAQSLGPWAMGPGSPPRRQGRPDRDPTEP